MVVVFLISSILWGCRMGGVGYNRMCINIFPYFISRYFSYPLGLMPFSSRAVWILVCMSVLVMVVIGIISMVVGFGFFSPNCIIHWPFPLVHFSQINRYNRRLATIIQQITITIIDHGGRYYFIHCWFCLMFFMILTMGTCVIEGNWVRTKSNFIFVMLSSPKIIISWKLNRVLFLLRKGSNWYHHRVMGNLQVNEFTACLTKSAKKGEQILGRVITAIGVMTILFSVLSGHMLSMGLCSTMARSTDLGKVLIQNF